VREGGIPRGEVLDRGLDRGIGHRRARGGGDDDLATGAGELREPRREGVGCLLRLGARDREDVGEAALHDLGAATEHDEEGEPQHDDEAAPADGPLTEGIERGGHEAPGVDL